MSELADPRHTRTPTILVVDDEQAIVQLCTVMLEHAGFAVVSATKSSEALKMCKDHPGSIDLLLTDVVMPPPEFALAANDNEFPNVHGHELAVRALRLRKDLRVILMSGNLDQELAGYGIRRGGLPLRLCQFRQSAVRSAQERGGSGGRDRALHSGSTPSSRYRAT